MPPQIVVCPLCGANRRPQSFPGTGDGGRDYAGGCKFCLLAAAQNPAGTTEPPEPRPPTPSDRPPLYETLVARIRRINPDLLDDLVVELRIVSDYERLQDDDPVAAKSPQHRKTVLDASRQIHARMKEETLKSEGGTGEAALNLIAAITGGSR